MNKLIIILYLFIIPSILRGENQTRYTPTILLPFEIDLIYRSIYLQPLTDLQVNKVKLITDKLNKNFPYLSKEEMFFLIKSEVYKTLLSNKYIMQDQIHQKVFLDKKTVELIKDFSKNKGLSPFASWVVKSIWTDVQKTINDNNKKRSTYKSLVTPWVVQILNNSAYEFNQICNDISFKILQRIHSKTLLTLNLTTFKDKQLKRIGKNKKPMIFFEKHNILQSENKNYLDDFLNEKETSKKNHKKRDNWLPRNGKEKVTLFPTPDPNYIPPKNLPEPIGDWDLPIPKNDSNIIVIPDPNYKPPTTLPIPVDDW